MLHEDRQRAGSFGDDAAQYDRARPSYPAALIDDLVVDGATDVLDVGCGTGIVSRLLVARGCTVLGVEPDARMAQVARASGIAVEISRFEAWDARGRRFRLLVCGQAWHWVDPVAGAAKAGHVLEPGGLVAPFWNEWRPEPGIEAALDAVYAERAPELARTSIVTGNFDRSRLDATAAALRADGGFAEPELRTYPWSRTYTTAQWVDQLPTHSDHRTMAPERLDHLLAGVGAALDAAGGALRVDYATQVVIARRHTSSR